MNFSFYPTQLNPLSGTQFINKFSNFIQLRARDLKIVAIAVIILAILAELAYLCWRSCRGIDLKQSVEKPGLPIIETPQQDPAPPEIMIPEAPAIDVQAIFSRLKSNTEQRESFPYTQLNCRFGDILCPVETNVQIPGSTEELYLHANHVQLEGLNFIASQYPLPEQVPLFWRAAQNACMIIDLTNKGDMGKGLLAYYPPLGDLKNVNELSISCESMHALENVQHPIYHYSVIDKQPCEGNGHSMPEPFKIARLHFEGWNDHQGISEDELDQILSVMKYYHHDSDPFLIHCRAGMGRTGTIIVAYVLQHLIDQNQINASNLEEHLCSLILEGRKQRGAAFVQTPQQFLALWKWSWRALHRGRESVAST